MTLLIAGLVLFLGIHTLPMLPATRAGLVSKLGENGYKGLYTLVSFAGFGLIIYGYGLARFDGPPIVYDPPFWLRHVTMLLMVPVFVFLVAAYVPSRIKKTLKHPMLVAVKLWAFAHLLANGDLASVLLFGGFLAWAVADRISVKRRGPGAGQVAAAAGDPGKYSDVVVILIGLALYGLFVWKLHAWLIGVPVG
ncbi:NnrU family protein [Roseibium sediminicola]|uniref:NnrU family protein n=1 Tax=Roseibium sediminicola TaxID=2933272 RepID=A0ABT0GXQ9_9HYPH|nr:NnrU family protein [Roseibium sp. CAU 1639]MCK7614226.1 NnrU family protein [Roseibium sp. CAU 1639]